MIASWITDLLGRRVEVRTLEGSWDSTRPDGRLVARGIVRGIGTVRDLPTLVLEVEYAGNMSGTLGMVPHNYTPVTDGVHDHDSLGRLHRRPTDQGRRGRAPVINENTSSLGMGPLGFDVEMARDHGWTDEEISAFWERMTQAYKREICPTIERRHPDRHAIGGDGSIIYVGCDDELPEDCTLFERIPIEVTSVTGYRDTVEDAYVVAHFAAHPGLGTDSDQWVVTHLPTGRSLPLGELDEYQARRCICHLHRVLGDIPLSIVSGADGRPVRTDDADEALQLVYSVCAQVLAYEDLVAPLKAGAIR